MAPTSGFVKWNEWLQRFNALRKRRFYKFGIPFFVLIFGGSFYLKQFTNIRFQYKPSVFIKPEDVDKVKSLKKTDPVTLETEFDKIKQANIEQWENVRIYRPWEDPANTEKK